ncbi:MAG TPA: hypothetical protein VN656_11045 [Stellaceae bacterium]|jgi:hypothetical protein|nr:hypothetical protein [Stellaceae bacterium]
MVLDIRDAREEQRLPVPVSPKVSSRNLAVRLHPAIYETIAALALLFVIGAWGFFAPNDTYYLLAIVTGFIFVAVFLPFQLWRVQRHGHDPRDTSLSHRSFWNWLDAELDVWQGRIKGRDAAAGILLPVAAVAIGMICFAIIINIEIG